MTTRTILIVDDDPEFRCLLKEIVESGGFSTLEAKDGSEGLARHALPAPSDRDPLRLCLRAHIHHLHWCSSATHARRQDEHQTGQRKKPGVWAGLFTGAPLRAS